MYISLYARAQNGKIKVWQAEEFGNHIAVWHGYYGGKLISHATKITMKDSNKQILSMIRAKKKEGYKDADEIANLSDDSTSALLVNEEWLNRYLPKTNLDANYNLKPMKCQPFKPNKFKYPAIAQPKLNGVRGVLRWELLTAGEGAFRTTAEAAVIRSKSGLIYHLPHITDTMVKDDFIDTDTGMLLAYDGEIYLHDTPLNIINGASPLINDRGTIAKSKYSYVTPNLIFVIFDTAIEDLSQENRTTIMQQVSVKIHVQVIGQITVYSDAEAIQYANECIANGYEGAVIRDIDAEYKFGSRPISMMKIKKFYDAEFKVIDIIPKPKEPDTGLFVCRNDISDVTFKVNPMGTYEQRKEYLDNKESYIGKMATVKYYERSGIHKVPFHANMVTIRNYE